MDKQYRGIIMPLNISLLGKDIFVGMQVLHKDERKIYSVESTSGVIAYLTTQGSNDITKVIKRNLKFIGVVFLDGKEKNSMAPLKHSQWEKCLETLEDADNRVVIVSVVGDTGVVIDRVFKTYPNAYCKILATPTRKFREQG